MIETPQFWLREDQQQLEMAEACYEIVWFISGFDPVMYHMSAKWEVMFLVRLVWQRDYDKSSGYIFMELSGSMSHRSTKNSLQFGGDPNDRADTQIAFHFH